MLFLGILVFLALLGVGLFMLWKRKCSQLNFQAYIENDDNPNALEFGITGDPYNNLASLIMDSPLEIACFLDFFELIETEITQPQN